MRPSASCLETELAKTFTFASGKKIHHHLPSQARSTQAQPSQSKASPIKKKKSQAADCGFRVPDANSSGSISVSLRSSVPEPGSTANPLAGVVARTSLGGSEGLAGGGGGVLGSEAPPGSGARGGGAVLGSRGGGPLARPHGRLLRLWFLGRGSEPVSRALGV